MAAIPYIILYFKRLNSVVSLHVPKPASRRLAAPSLKWSQHPTAVFEMFYRAIGGLGKILVNISESHILFVSLILPQLLFRLINIDTLEGRHRRILPFIRPNVI